MTDLQDTFKIVWMDPEALIDGIEEKSPTGKIWTQADFELTQSLLIESLLIDA